MKCLSGNLTLIKPEPATVAPSSLDAIVSAISSGFLPSLPASWSATLVEKSPNLGSGIVITGRISISNSLEMIWVI